MLKLAQVATALESNSCAKQSQGKVWKNRTGKNEGNETEKKVTEDMRNLTSVVLFCLFCVQCHSNCQCRLNVEPLMLPAS